MDGILNIFKPKGLSSFKALAIVKGRLCRQLGLKGRSLKVGHLGTLDPAAVGVLILLIGKACKLNNQLSNGQKTYRFVMTTGIETPSLDLETDVSKTSDIIPTRNQILSVLPSLIGQVEIEVPKFSAVHINGERAYDLARKGIDFSPPKKLVTINSFTLLDDTNYLSLHKDKPLLQNEFYFEVNCQTGTYIRSLAKLLASKLGTVAVASTIIRTNVSGFSINDSKMLDEVLASDIMPLN